jgi:hypothetical protein
VPEDQLETTIKEYNHYIVAVILGLVILAVVWFVVKNYISKKRIDNN